MSKKVKFVFWLYCLLMLWLLFGQRVDDFYGQGTYLEQLRTNTNLVPFKTIALYWRLLTTSTNTALIRHAVINLLGNIIMFIPLGWFLPSLWEKFRSFWRTILSVVLLMTSVEIFQLLTLLGSCDTDDLMLNVLGAAIGFVIYKTVKKGVT